MTRIAETFAQLRTRRAGAFVPFVMIGDPHPEASFDIIETLIGAGADMLELGIPFSDPPGDGPVVQAAAQRALAAGMTTMDALALIRRIRERHTLPISVLCYYNSILQYDVERFYHDAAAAGVDAVLVADVALEESAILVEHSRAYGVHPIFIVSEVTPERRLAQIAAIGEGYLYLVARVGVTGEHEVLATGLRDVFQRIRAQTSLPTLAGFGISTPAHVRDVLAAGADGVICGSAIVRRVAEGVASHGAMIHDLRHFVAQMKRAAVDPSTPME